MPLIKRAAPLASTLVSAALLCGCQSGSVEAPKETLRAAAAPTTAM